MKESNIQEIEYEFIFWNEFNYSILSNVKTLIRHNQKDKKSCNDAIIFLDTETSKSVNRDDNYIVLWTISIRVEHKNIVTLYGNKPSDCVLCLEQMQHYFNGVQTFIYIHNLPYDFCFLQKFLIKKFGEPIYQLNVKSHYPIYIEFENGVILRDSLILFQRSLEKTAIDFDAEHKKAIGQWDYDAIRYQNSDFTALELQYSEYDTLVGVECIDALKTALNKTIYGMPWTATGIVRDKIQYFGYKNNGHKYFLQNQLSLEDLYTFHQFYHGGYCHGNRNFYDWVLTYKEIGEYIVAYDFSSSYPFTLLSERFPSEKFMSMPNCSLDDIINDSDNAYIFKLIAVNVELKEYDFPMPSLQYSKVTKVINPVVDNGRILSCAYCEIILNEIDASIIKKLYNIEKHICIDVKASYKDYLPRWLTDFVFSLYESKCRLKGKDPVLYALSKSQLNSVYGMCCFYPIKPDIVQDYKTGEFYTNEINEEEKYNEYCKKNSTVLPYQIGCWVTSYGMKNLFELGDCIDGEWLYSDTDSCYAYGWNEEKIESYNNKCKKKLLSNGYGAVKIDDKEYWLGIAELDGIYSEFKVCGCKRYCTRDAETNELKITVAGVPKKSGGKCLEDDINNFKPGFIFSGKITNKKTHTYIYRDDIFIDEFGNEIGDSINLSECDYKLSSAKEWSKIENFDALESIVWYEEE